MSTLPRDPAASDTRSADDPAAGIGPAEVGSLVEPRIRQVIAQLPENIHTIVAYHRGWCDADGRAQQGAVASGYGLASLVLLGSAAVGAGPGPRTLAGAVAAESAQDCAMLHDDIADQDPVRHGRPAAWQVFGLPRALTAGEALQALATRILLHLDDDQIALRAVRLLDEGIATTIDGQMHDLTLQQRPEVPWEECVQMAHDKAGGLISAAAALGGLLGGGSAEHIEALRQFGWWFALATQTFNDLQDLFPQYAATGTPRRADLRARRMTIPIAAALRASDTPAQQLADLLRSERALTDQETAHAAQLIENNGGRTAAEALLRHALHQASQCLHLLPDSDARSRLQDLPTQYTRL